MFYVDDANKAWYAKDSVDARLFLAQSQFSGLVDDMRYKVHACVAHNRYATVGDHTYEEAHPYVAGPITLVHNGTLRGYTALPLHPTASTDSARAAMAFSEDVPGGIKTLESLSGDFAFVWHDARNNSLHFATNGRRPLSYVRGKEHLCFASEGPMITMLLHRTMHNNPYDKWEDFEPFKLYTLPMGKLDWTVEDFEDSWKGSGYYHHNSGYEWEEDAWDNDRKAWGRIDVTPIADKRTEPQKPKQVEAFPNESKKSQRKRVSRTNRLMQDWGLDLRVGERFTVNMESVRQYDTNHNKARPDSRGAVEGFYYLRDGTAEFAYCAEIHQVLLDDIDPDYVDTVHAQLAAAYVDDQGDLNLVGLYQEVGSYRHQVQESMPEEVWPKFLRKFFENQRWWYNTSDRPTYKWFHDEVSISARELDMLLEGKVCNMDQCQMPARMVPRDEIVFVAPQTFVCKDCTAHTCHVDPDTNDIVPGPLDMEEKNGLWVPVASVKHGIPVTEKRRCTIDKDGNMVDKISGEILRQAKKLLTSVSD
jgi:hypothetical protein